MMWKRCDEPWRPAVSIYSPFLIRAHLSKWHDGTVWRAIKSIMHRS